MLKMTGDLPGLKLMQSSPVLAKLFYNSLKLACIPASVRHEWPSYQNRDIVTVDGVKAICISKVPWICLSPCQFSETPNLASVWRLSWKLSEVLDRYMLSTNMFLDSTMTKFLSGPRGISTRHSTMAEYSIGVGTLTIFRTARS